MSRLLENSEGYRKNLLTKNTFDKNGEYNTNHKNALSDGDEFGKGENNGQVGGATDIVKRKELLTKSIYSSNKEYNINNA